MINAQLSTKQDKDITLIKYKTGFRIKIKMLIMQFVPVSTFCVDGVVADNANQTGLILIKSGVF